MRATTLYGHLVRGNKKAWTWALCARHFRLAGQCVGRALALQDEQGVRLLSLLGLENASLADVLLQSETPEDRANITKGWRDAGREMLAEMSGRDGLTAAYRARLFRLQADLPAAGLAEPLVV